MGQTLVLNYLHIVFSTKNRQNLIDEEIETELLAYLSGICNKLDCLVINIGSYKNHVHILCNLSKKTSLSILLENLKGSSSKWIKKRSSKYHNFYWQEGFGAFSVSRDKVQYVSGYIGNQKLHHSGKSFETEYLEFLKENDVQYDNRYIWE